MMIRAIQTAKILANDTKVQPKIHQRAIILQYIF